MQIRAKGGSECRSTCAKVYLRTVAAAGAHDAIESCSLGMDPSVFAKRGRVSQPCGDPFDMAASRPTDH